VWVLNPQQKIKTQSAYSPLACDFEEAFFVAVDQKICAILAKLNPNLTTSYLHVLGLEAFYHH
jgi:hypothetical protein